MNVDCFDICINGKICFWAHQWIYIIVIMFMIFFLDYSLLINNIMSLLRARRNIKPLLKNFQDKRNKNDYDSLFTQVQIIQHNIPQYEKIIKSNKIYTNL